MFNPTNAIDFISKLDQSQLDFELVYYANRPSYYMYAEKLIEHGANINKLSNYDKYSVLTLAVYSNNFKLVDLLVKNNVI